MLSKVSAHHDPRCTNNCNYGKSVRTLEVERESRRLERLFKTPLADGERCNHKPSQSEMVGFVTDPSSETTTNNEETTETNEESTNSTTTTTTSGQPNATTTETNISTSNRNTNTSGSAQQQFVTVVDQPVEEQPLQSAPSAQKLCDTVVAELEKLGGKRIKNATAPTPMTLLEQEINP